MGICSRRGSVVSCVDWLMGRLVCSRVTDGGGASVRGVVRGTILLGCWGEGACSMSTGNAASHLRIAYASGSLLTLPELSTTTAARVVVGWARTEALLFLMVTAKCELDESRDEEEDTTIGVSTRSCSGL